MMFSVCLCQASSQPPPFLINNSTILLKTFTDYIHFNQYPFKNRIYTWEHVIANLIDEIMQTEKQRKAFGKRLKELCNQKRITQKKEVAAKLGLQLSQYNKYESGIHIPIADKRILLAELFTTSIDYLLIGTYDEHSTMNNTRLFERFRH